MCRPPPPRSIRGRAGGAGSGLAGASKVGGTLGPPLVTGLLVLSPGSTSVALVAAAPMAVAAGRSSVTASRVAGARWRTASPDRRLPNPRQHRPTMASDKAGERARSARGRASVDLHGLLFLSTRQLVRTNLRKRCKPTDGANSPRPLIAVTHQVIPDFSFPSQRAVVGYVRHHW